MTKTSKVIENLLKKIEHLESVIKNFEYSNEIIDPDYEDYLKGSFYCEKQTNLLKQCKKECDYCKSLNETKQFTCGNDYRKKDRCKKQCGNCKG